MLGFKHDQLPNFFLWLSLVEKQINLDPTEKSSNNAFQVKTADPYDGDFSDKNNWVDLVKFQQCTDWLIEQLGWQSGDIVLEDKSSGRFLKARDPSAVMDYLKTHQTNSETISHIVPQYPKALFFTRDTFATTNLSAKGIAVLQHIFSEKDGTPNHTFVAKDGHLEKIFNILNQADNGVSFTIFVRFGEAHWTPIHLMKKNNKYHIIEMDSEGVSKDYGSKIGNTFITNAAQKSLPCQDVSIYRTFNMRQSGPNNCGIFTIKDGRKIQRSQDLLAEITPYIVSKRTFTSGITYHEYLTPERFEPTVQDRKDLSVYIKKLNQIKQVHEQALLDASFNKVRNNAESTVETGPLQKNNMTIHYFKELYVKRVKAVVDSTHFQDLKDIVDQHSSDTLTVERVNATKRLDY